MNSIFEDGDDRLHEPAYLITPDGYEIEGTWDETYGFDDSTLHLIAGNIEESATTGSTWHSFVEIRNRLEPQGYRFRCHGARADVMPSPMSVDMGGGVMAYQLHDGKDAAREDLIYIFDTDESLVPVTIAEQEAAYERWLENRPKLSPSIRGESDSKRLRRRRLQPTKYRWEMILILLGLILLLAVLGRVWG